MPAPRPIAVRPVQGERVVPVEKTRSKQSYDFVGPSGTLRPWVLWTEDDPANPAGLGWLGVVIPYTAESPTGYLVFVPPDELTRE